MNLFRSEEHIRNWSGYQFGTEEGILALGDLVRVFSGPFFRNRLVLDYVSNREEYVGSFLSAVSQIAQKRPFWKVGPVGEKEPAKSRVEA